MSSTLPGGVRAAHAAMRGYASRHGIDPASFRSDGRVTLTIDDTYRILVRPAPDGRLALSCMLANLGGMTPSRLENLLLQMTKIAGGMLRDHASGLAVDEAAERLLLQQMLPASTDVASFEQELAEFVNVLAFWTRMTDQETARA